MQSRQNVVCWKLSNYHLKKKQKKHTNEIVVPKWILHQWWMFEFGLEWSIQICKNLANQMSNHPCVSHSLYIFKNTWDKKVFFILLWNNGTCFKYVLNILS